ncbi:hypothetical protein CLI92_08105 [Vandammella animalimorsus]|uniref:Dual-action ribosomal maturation protein DarP n=1 Tax=Vandammella animalimorsus TaxID=2029117 RepID=A0A2A2B1B1_9BURK|nr:ribosome biogenesis factor YjgA [Vandammella animalimorsus]PAT32296.1 hypothetical protein CK626_05840 [Vandammella animalimorsus]PAT43814.1 hypothetical protein CK621_01985 [Vandammella animalimorsus]PAX16738.1 hypothetical protein CLI92_08105 [Vandammella animalimorsus]PAX19372.1 hypothetical protein CLI93_09125 [Vandammella animalimorsus]
MQRKSPRGYFVRGHFVAAGSEEDQQFKAELKGREVSKSDKKRESHELQALGEALLGLRSELFARLSLPDALCEALQEARRISDFEGRRRQMQYVGKLMRRLDAAEIDAIRAALDIQKSGSAEEKQALHEAEQWRERLLADDQALTQWLQHYPAGDVQQLRSLIRQARKESPAATAAETSQGKAPRKGKAYRELFQWIDRARRAQAEQAEDQRHYREDDGDGEGEA